MLAFKIAGSESRLPSTLRVVDRVKPFILKLRPNALRLEKCCVWQVEQAIPVWRAKAGTRACRGGGRSNPVANPATTTNLFRDMAQDLLRGCGSMGGRATQFRLVLMKRT